MVTAGEIVERTGELFDAIAELLVATEDLGLPSLAATLGVAETAAELTRSLGGVLVSISPQLEILISLGRLGALFGMVEPLVDALGGLFADAGLQLAELGLGDALSVTGPIASGFEYLESTAALGSTLIIDPSQLDELREGLGDTIEALAALADEFDSAAQALPA